jgi:PIN domain
MVRIVYLFPDTNVLVQCRPLDQVDWSGWQDFDEVHLVISRPIQAEIDEQKNKGGDRLAKKARAAASRIRDLITGEDDHELVRPSGPTVKLFLDPRLRPSEELADVLDYSLTDDRLVGLVHAFAKQNEGADARVLTHDTGPMATARMVGVAFSPVPDGWLLPPEPSESDRRVRALEAEVARLTDNEPKFAISCVDANGNELESWVITHPYPSDQAAVRWGAGAERACGRRGGR